VARSIKAVVSAVSPNVHPATEAAAIHAFAELWAAPEHWRMAAEADARRRAKRPNGADGPVRAGRRGDPAS
jgi:hypothetical protein